MPTNFIDNLESPTKQLGSFAIGYALQWRKSHSRGMLKGIVEIDETYVGGKRREGSKRGRGTKKTPGLVLIERNGRVRYHKLDNLTAETIKGLIRNDVEITAHIMTDVFK